MKSARTLEFTIPEEWANIRLDKALSFHPEMASRSKVEKLLELGLIKVAGKTPKGSQIAIAGQEVRIEIPIVPTDLMPLDMDLDIVFEDLDLLVINKPAGLVVHPAEGHEQDTLVNAILAHTTDLSMGFGEKRPGIVHRLDKDTSGLLVVAKNDRSHEALAKQFHDRLVHRVYWALVYGMPKTLSGRIENQLGRSHRNRKAFASVTQGGKRAVTNYEVKGTYIEAISLIHIKLETGRTHQIRVHLSELGHPIVGDSLYGADRFTKKIESQKLRDQIEDLDRFALHAAELGFTHPRTGQVLQFQVPWPVDLIDLVSMLRLNNFR